MLLKIGRLNNIDAVKAVQKVLVINQDGDFGPTTFKYVKAYQAANGLKPIDGVVGPTTASHMGIDLEEFLDTDLSELVKKKGEDRKILIYIGKASHRKYFGELVKLAKANKDTVYVVVAGYVLKECIDEADELRAINMMVVDHYISNDELLSLNMKSASKFWGVEVPIGKRQTNRVAIKGK